MAATPQLMALVRESDLFKCGIAWVAVTDINLLFTANWSDTTDSARRYGMRTMIGDRKSTQPS